MPGLSPEHHGDLNRATEVYPGGKDARAKRLTQLREQYAGDRVALQQLDVYSDEDNAYHQALRKYKAAILSGNITLQSKLEEWLKENYPDI